MIKADFVGGDEYPETINGAYELLLHTSRQFYGIMLRGGRRNFINEGVCGGRTRVMFTQTRGRGNRCKFNSTPGRNSYQGDPVTVKDVQLYRHTYCSACHIYGHFSNQFPDKKPKAINLAVIGFVLM